jgi:hypothetical protein
MTQPIPRYVVIDVRNNEVWNFRLGRWTKTVTKGSSYKGIRTRGGVTTSLACEMAQENLHRLEENFHREIEIHSVSYMVKDPIKRDITITI